MTDTDQTSGTTDPRSSLPADEPRRTRTRLRRNRAAGADVAPAAAHEAAAGLPEPPTAADTLAEGVRDPSPAADTPAEDVSEQGARRRRRRRLGGERAAPTGAGAPVVIDTDTDAGTDTFATDTAPDDRAAVTSTPSGSVDDASADATPADATQAEVDGAAEEAVATDAGAIATDGESIVTDGEDVPTDSEAVATDESAGTAAGETEGEGRPSRSSRRRGGRGRRRRGGRGRSRAGDAAPDSDTPGELVDAEPLDAEIDAAASAAAEADSTADTDRLGPTRLQAGRGARTARGPRGRTATASATGRRPLGGVSEETRRSVTEGPPRRMFVTVGEERTQIAVLEERQLVEHYVTRRSDVSYVGNIYLGRVQNVLPGMEAAFIDIGKGRNGVLYAGEVNYDEADLEGELPRIEQTLKPGQAVLVQVTKDPMGTKGARLTQHLSVAGRYCVLAPGDGMLGISRKLTDDERERLRKILKGIRPEGFGLIVRTAAEGATREQLEADVARLVRIWDSVTEKAEQAKPLEPVYSEPDLVIRVIRDVFGPEYSELIVDSEDLAAQIRDYLGDVSPEFVEKVAVHNGDDHVFDAYEITNQIRRALERKVWLKSGGYLIVEKTEAMWVIDVNTGKFVGERNLEETVLRNNIEAAVEIARQLRLRDMGGIIVIDFVDMLMPANRDEVLKRFKRELARDKTKSRVMDISKLGLVQMTRKNVSQGLQESFTTRCDVCEGRGARIVERIV